MQARGKPYPPVTMPINPVCGVTRAHLRRERGEQLFGVRQDGRRHGMPKHQVGLQYMLRCDLVNERLALARYTPASARLDSAAAEVKRSSTSSTGNPKRAPSSRANLRARRDSSCSRRRDEPAIQHQSRGLPFLHQLIDAA
jgi:hypothetical protein